MNSRTESITGSGPVYPTSVAQVEAWSQRRVPPVEQVREDLWVVPVPVPTLPIRFTYCYVILCGGGAIVIDPGAVSVEGARAQRRGFNTIGITAQDVIGIVVTHFHFDHWEAADDLRREGGGWVGLGEHELGWINSLKDDEVTQAAASGRLRRLGVPESAASALAEGEDYRFTRDHIAPSEILRDGELISVEGERLRIMWTPGHSPGHVCIYDEKRNILFSGDHVLPRITPHIALNPFGDQDPLGQYLHSLDRVAELPASVEVMPAHEYRFRGLGPRIEALRERVAARADEVCAVRARTPDATGWDVARQLTWSRPWADFTPNAQRMAVVEAASYMQYVSSGR